MTWHCDWIAARIPLPRDLRINKGRMIFISTEGEKVYTQFLHRQAVGSYDSRMQVRADGMELAISGNPTKFLQGHNVYGLPGTSCLAVPLATAILTSLGLYPWHWMSDAAERGEWPLTTIDLTRGYRPPGAVAGWVPKWLDIASRVASTSRQKVESAGPHNGNTLYAGKHSRRLALKFYDKEAELKKRKLPACMPDDAAASVAARAAGVLRVELRVRSLELVARGLERLDYWTLGAGDALLDERIAAVNLPEDLRMSEEQLDDLPKRLRAVYGLWLSGADLRKHYSRTQFWRYRRDLRAYGIDVSHTRPPLPLGEDAAALGRPLADFLVGPGLAPPGIYLEREEVA